MSNFTPNAEFYLVEDVDIDVSYNHQYYFETEAEQNEFFMLHVFMRITTGTYQRKNSNTIAVPVLADSIRNCKYIMWKNSVTDKWYYAFVTAINYVNPNVSNIIYQLDVYQTYLFDMEWKESFIQRQHCKQYETDIYSNKIPVLNDAPETLDYGSEYRILKKTRLKQNNRSNVAFLVCGFSERIDTEYQTPGSIQGIATNISYYILPFRTDDTTSIHFVTSQSGDTITTVDLITPWQMFNLCTNNENLVGKMVSATIIPFLTIADMEIDSSYDMYCDNVECIEFKPSIGLSGFHFLKVKNNATDIIQPIEISTGVSIQDFYSLCNYSESKLYQYPYSFTELSTERGDTYIIRNEYIKNSTGEIVVKIFGTINFQNKMAYIVKDYLSEGTFLENGIHDSSNLNVPIIDDYTASYLQSNSNSMAVARSNALNSYVTEIANASRTATTNLSNNKRSIEYGTAANVATTSGNILGNLLNGNIGGMVSSGLNGVGNEISLIGDYYNTVDSTNTSKINSYASSRVSYTNAVASVMAKYQDAQQVPSTVRSMGGDYLFNIANDCDGLYLLEKTIMPEVAERLEAYFKQYGYAYNKVEVPNFHTRKYWNYISMAEPNVTGNIPMDDLMQIRDIFLKGITLWHGDYIGDYSKDNKEV